MTRFVPCIVLTCLFALPCTRTSAEEQEKPAATVQDTPLSERLPPKIHKIQQELPAWVQNGGDKDEATALMQKLKENLDGKNFEEAEKTADSILKMIGKSAPAPAEDTPEEVRIEAAHQRVAAKIERVNARAHKWEASGRDTSAIARMMEEKVKPLVVAGKFSEAEVELDRVLNQLNKDAESSESPATPAEAVRQRVAAKIKNVEEEAHKWEASGRDTSAIAGTMEENVKPLIDAGKFGEAEVELDRVLKQFTDDTK